MSCNRINAVCVQLTEEHGNPKEQITTLLAEITEVSIDGVRVLCIYADKYTSAVCTPVHDIFNNLPIRIALLIN